MINDDKRVGEVNRKMPMLEILLGSVRSKHIYIYVMTCFEAGEIQGEDGVARGAEIMGGVGW